MGKREQSTLRCLRSSYYDRSTDNRVPSRVLDLLLDTSPVEVDEASGTRIRPVCVGNTGLMHSLSVHIRPPDVARMINNTVMKTRNEMIREYYINSDVRDNPHHNLLLLKHPPLFCKKQTGPTASFMSMIYHEHNLENKDSRLTTLSGCAPADAPPC